MFRTKFIVGSSSSSNKQIQLFIEVFILLKSKQKFECEIKSSFSTKRCIMTIHSFVLTPYSIFVYTGGKNRVLVIILWGFCGDIFQECAMNSYTRFTMAILDILASAPKSSKSAGLLQWLVLFHYMFDEMTSDSAYTQWEKGP